MSYNLFAVPYHIFMNVKKHEGDKYILEIPAQRDFLNHLGTVHASVQIFLAEASSGEFLLREFNQLDGLIPVVRKTEAKYHKPACGTLYSKTTFDSLGKEDVLRELNSRNRSLVKIRSEIYDSNGTKALTAVFEWFLSKEKTEG